MTAFHLIAVLSAVTIVSQFHRSSLAVIAPELVRDLGLGPGALGLASGAFFAVLVVVQLPVGVLLDWIGPRRLVGALTGVAVAGSLMTAAATDAAERVAARAIVGLGCAAYFMAAIPILLRSLAGDRLGTALPRIFALRQIGNPDAAEVVDDAPRDLLAGRPLAALSAAAGWRTAFVLAAAATGAASAAFWWTLRDDRPLGGGPAAPELLGRVTRGVAEVVRTPELAPVLAIQTVAYAVVSTILGLWAGP